MVAQRLESLQRSAARHSHIEPGEEFAGYPVPTAG
jgi:hypothetical protein